MQLGMIGLGRMGANIVRRLMKNGHTAVVYDKDPKAVATLDKEGAKGASSLEDFVNKLDKPATVWVMLPAGKITEATIAQLHRLLKKDDVIIDGGDKAVVDRIDPILNTLAPGIGDIPRTPHRDGRDPRVELGYIHAGPVGAG